MTPYKKYRKIRRKLTHEEVHVILQNCEQSLTAEDEMIWYWTKRLNKELEPVDIWILHTDKFKTAQEAIEQAKQNQAYLLDKINDLYRFFDPSKKYHIFFKAMKPPLKSSNESKLLLECLCCGGHHYLAIDYWSDDPKEYTISIIGQRTSFLEALRQWWRHRHWVNMDIVASKESVDWLIEELKKI